MHFVRHWLRKVREYCVPSARNSYRPHLLRRRALMFLLGMALVTEALLVGNLALRQAGLPFLAAVIQSEVVVHTNEARVAEGEGVLTENALLTAAAYAKAADMAEKGYFAHVGPTGKEPWEWLQEIGYDYRAAGENLAVRFVDSRDVVNAWMDSPTHKANIVKPIYTEIGIGVADGVYKGEKATYVVQYFGTPRQGLFAGQGAALSATQSFYNSFIRQIGGYFADPRNAAGWTLSLIAGALIAVLGVTVIRHMQIQPAEVLAPGAAVAMVAIALLLLNGAVLTPRSDPQTASVGAVMLEGGGAVER